MQATLEALTHEMAHNPAIFVFGEGIGVRGGNFGTTVGLFAKYGAQRLRDTPIAERGFVGMACGAAMTGARPVVDFMFIDFINEAFGELVNQIAKMQYMSSGRLKMPVLLRGCVGIGHAAATHHSGSYHSIYSHIPGLRVVVPSNPYDAKGLLIAAIEDNDPVIFLEPKRLYNGPFDGHHERPVTPWMKAAPAIITIPPPDPVPVDPPPVIPLDPQTGDPLPPTGEPLAGIAYPGNWLDDGTFRVLAGLDFMHVPLPGVPRVRDLLTDEKKRALWDFIALPSEFGTAFVTAPAPAPASERPATTP